MTSCGVCIINLVPLGLSVMQLGNTNVLNGSTMASVFFMHNVRNTALIFVVVAVLKYLTLLYAKGVYWGRFPKCGPRVVSEVINTLIAIRAVRIM
jgi:hypothetical protein